MNYINNLRHGKKIFIGAAVLLIVVILFKADWSAVNDEPSSPMIKTTTTTVETKFNWETFRTCRELQRYAFKYDNLEECRILATH